MKTLKLNTEGNIAYLQLNRPKANALNMDMMLELQEVLSELESDENVKGLILTGAAPIFSVGLDVIELYSYDEATMTKFWMEFKSAVYALYTFPKPVVAAVSGHAPAGGCILALCADYRVMLDGPFKIGLNEAAVSIVVPQPIDALLSSVVGAPKARKLLMNGEMLSCEDALSTGMVDELTTSEALIPSAKAKLEMFLKLPQEAWKVSKFELRSALAEILLDETGKGFSATASFWWNQASRDFIGKMIAQLSAGKQ